jgi:hypothetical protein
MRKDEVTFHSDGFFSDLRPAVNVKVQAWGNDYADAAAKFARENISDPFEEEAFRVAYGRMLDNDDESNTMFEWACESGWENLDSDANWLFCPWGKDAHDNGECYGDGTAPDDSKRHVTVGAEGRSGGWAVVEGLPEFDSWDAIMLGKWARFAKVARALADDVPYSMAELFYLNRFEGTYDQRQPMRRALVGAGMGV